MTEREEALKLKLQQAQDEVQRAGRNAELAHQQYFEMKTKYGTLPPVWSLSFFLKCFPLLLSFHCSYPFLRGQLSAQGVIIADVVIVSLYLLLSCSLYGIM